MTRRAAIASEADIKRTIRAAQASGLVITRIVARPDGIAIETDKAPSPFIVAKANEEAPAAQDDSTWKDVDGAP